jgi:hypothetical protein
MQNVFAAAVLPLSRAAEGITRRTKQNFCLSTASQPVQWTAWERLAPQRHKGRKEGKFFMVLGGFDPKVYERK